MRDLKAGGYITHRSALLMTLAAATLSAGSLTGCSLGSAQREPQVALEDPAVSASERGEQLLDQGFREQALVEFQKAIEINPRLTSAHLGIGDIYKQEGDYEKAEKAFGTAANIEPQNYDAQYKHGLSLQLLNRAADAVRAYLRALLVRPESFDANLSLATAYLQLGEPAQALPYAEKAVRLDPDSGPALANLGAAYSGLGRHEQAIASYRQAAERMDLTPELLLNLADSLGRVGRHAEMASTLEELIKVKPSAAAFERLGSARFRLRQYDQSLAMFRKALELDPNHFPALNGVGVNMLNRYVWSNKQDRAALDEARAALRRSLQIEQRQPRIVDLLGRYE